MDSIIHLLNDCGLFVFFTKAFLYDNLAVSKNGNTNPRFNLPDKLFKKLNPFDSKTNLDMNIAIFLKLFFFNQSYVEILSGSWSVVTCT